MRRGVVVVIEVLEAAAAAGVGRWQVKQEGRGRGTQKGSLQECVSS